MFKDLAKYRVILVTGPHRSGTTICARMIANDTGHDFVIEDEFAFANLAQLSAYVHSSYGPVVIQCPFLSHVIDDLKYLIDLDYSEALVVMMHRHRPDIIRSEQKSKVDFYTVGMRTKQSYNDETDRHPSDTKYSAWEDQCKCVPHAMDVGYESLKDHPLWIEDRSGMKFQHAVGKGRISQVFRNGILALQDI